MSNPLKTFKCISIFSMLLWGAKHRKQIIHININKEVNIISNISMHSKHMEILVVKREIKYNEKLKNFIE